MPSLLLSLGLLSLGCGSRSKPVRMTRQLVVVGDSDSPLPSDKVHTEPGADTGSADFDTDLRYRPSQTDTAYQRDGGLGFWAANGRQPGW